MVCKKVLHQHGDLLFHEVAEIPQGAKKIDLKEQGFVVERGEGVHTHVMEALDLNALCDLVEAYEHEGNLYVRVKKGQQVKLTHEEHGTQIVKEGTHKKVIEREYSYEQNEERRVID